MKVTTIDIPIYGGQLVIITAKRLTDVNKPYGVKFTKAFGAGVFTRKKEPGKYFVAFEGKPTGALIAHECVHLVNEVFINCVIQADRHNDEPYAYLLMWFYEQIEKFFNYENK